MQWSADGGSPPERWSDSSIPFVHQGLRARWKTIRWRSTASHTWCAASCLTSRMARCEQPWQHSASCHAWRRRLLLPATHSLRARPCASDVACAWGERRAAFTSIPVSCLMIMEWGMPQGDSIAIFCMDVDQQRREDLIHGQGVVDTQRSPEPDVHRLHRQKAQAPWLARLDSWARACRGTCRPGAAPGGR